MRHYATAEAAERNRISSRNAKRRRKGVCSDCGGVTGYDGKRGTSPRCVRCARLASRDWSPETIIAAVQRWAAEHDGKPPVYMDWVRAGPYWPAGASCYADSRHFATWGDVIVAAGFPRPLTGNPRWSRETMIAAIQAWAAKNGRPPHMSDWEKKGNRDEGDFPHSNTVAIKFGSWNAAIEAAGFEPRRSRRS